MMDDILFSLPVKNGIPSKEDAVAALIVVWADTVLVYKILTLEEAKIEHLMKAKL